MPLKKEQNFFDVRKNSWRERNRERKKGREKEFDCVY